MSNYDQPYTAAELAACARREAGYRKSCYPRWGNCAFEDLPPKKRHEIAMMEQIAREYDEKDKAQI